MHTNDSFLEGVKRLEMLQGSYKLLNNTHDVLQFLLKEVPETDEYYVEEHNDAAMNASDGGNFDDTFSSGAYHGEKLAYLTIRNMLTVGLT